MLQPLVNLGGTGSIRTVVHNLAFWFYHLSPTLRACRALLPPIKYLVKEGELLPPPNALLTFGCWPYDLRYHITCSLDNNGIALADVLAPDVIFVVQGCLFNSHPPH
ncbi:hypothetical protein ES703_84185 [subsurface metagenome]